MTNYVIYITIRSRKTKAILKKTMINICNKMNFYHSICYRLNITNDINNKNDILQSKKKGLGIVAMYLKKVMLSNMRCIHHFCQLLPELASSPSPARTSVKNTS